MIRTTPGSQSWALWLNQREWRDGSLEDVNGWTVILHPQNHRVTFRHASSLLTELGRAAVLPSDRDFLINFASADRLTVEHQGRLLVDISLASARAAIEAFQRCEHQVMREWGIDPSLFDRVRALPTFNMAEILNDSDYPEPARRASLEGTSTVRVTISEQGRVSECATVATSGHAILDERTCEVLTARVQTSPALDFAGRPISVPLVTSVRWRMY